MTHRYIVGIDIGGTKTAVVLASMQRLTEPTELGDCFLDKIVFATPIGGDSAKALPMIIDAIDQIIDRNSVARHMMCAIGISCGGPLDSTGGIIKSPPNLYGWNDVPIVELLRDEFDTLVALQNDANACALAEWKFGAGRGTRNMIFLTMGTGMGAGLILDGRLYSGTSDMAGEIGHIRLSSNGPVGYGKAGSFEGFCSGGGIAQLATTMALERLQQGRVVGYCSSLDEMAGITAKSVSEAAALGDEAAIEVYQRVGQYLGKGIAILVDILNPEKVIIGSIFQRSSSLLRQAAQQVLQEEALHSSCSVCSVEPALLGDNLGDFASVSVALAAVE